MSASSGSVVRQKSLALATLLLVSLIAAGPLWGPGLLNTRAGGDSPFLLLRTHQLAVNLRSGVFPARWMPDAAYGFGYPFFSYYAALPYYLAAGFTLIGLDILTAIKLTQTLFFAAAALTMYHWAERVLHNRAGAWLAAVAYTAAPFHLVNVYVRGDSLSEFAAFAFYPLILWGLDRLARQPTLQRTLPPALAYAGLIVTHNVSALIFSPFVVLYTAVHMSRLALQGSERRWRQKLSCSALLILPLLAGLLLSAWFWVPALRETDTVQLVAQTTGYFFYGNHFRRSDLIQWRPVFDYTTGRDHGSPFAMGLVQTVLASVGVLIVSVGYLRGTRGPRARQRSRRSSGPSTRESEPAPWIPAFAILGLLLYTWLITPLSRPLWNHLPLLPMAQFPWRFLSVQALFSALLTGVTISPLSRPSGPATSWVGAALLGALLVTTALAGLRPEYLPIRPDEVTAERLQLYELFTGNVGSTIRHEYLPRWVKPRPYTGPALFRPGAPARVFLVDGTVSRARRLERGPTFRLWEVEAVDADSVVAFPLYYWPGWQATVDGVPVEIAPAPGSGYLSMRIPSGPHTVEIWLGRTPLRLWCEIASLVTGLAALGLWVVGWRRGRKRRERGKDKEARTKSRQSGSRVCDAGAIVSWLPFFVVLGSLLAFHPRVTVTGRYDLTMDFEEMPYLHHNPDGVAFDGWQLTGYDYERDEVAPGQAFHVTLDWSTGDDQSPASAEGPVTTVRLISPAAIRDETILPVVETTLASDEQGNTTDVRGTGSVDLVVPADTTPGLYFPQMGRESPVTLRPMWISDARTAAGEPVVASFAGERIRLHEAQAAQSAPDRVRVQLDWSAAQPVGVNYGLSLSLTDAAGNEWLRQGGEPGYDTQPGHGFAPTSLWPVNRVIRDDHTVALEAGAPPGDGYVLTVDLYYVATWQSVGAYTTTVPVTQVTERPDAPVVAHMGEELALSRLETPQSVRQGDRVDVSAYWMVVERPSADYVAEWRLETSEGSITSTQPLVPGSSPVDWPVGAWITGRVHLAVPPSGPAGEHTLSLTVRDPTSGATLGSYTHPAPIRVEERRRTWELPPMDQTVGARFGGIIELAGYNLSLESGNVHLTLHWQALATPDQHYMFFVHLADPKSGQPLRQVDEMPKGFTYPTGLWVPGEVVSDEVELPVEGLPPGRYDLAVGWFDPETEVRLPAVDGQGRPVPDNRLVLPDGVSLP